MDFWRWIGFDPSLMIYLIFSLGYIKAAITSNSFAVGLAHLYLIHVGIHIFIFLYFMLHGISIGELHENVCL